MFAVVLGITKENITEIMTNHSAGCFFPIRSGRKLYLKKTDIRTENLGGVIESYLNYVARQMGHIMTHA